MKSVGEAMALGRNFTEALNKAMRSMETKAAGFWTAPGPVGATLEDALDALRTPHDGRLYTVERALRLGATRRAGARGQRRDRPVVRRPDRGAGRPARARSSTRRCSTSRCCAGPSGPGCPTGSSPRCGRSSPARTGCARCGTGSACGRSTRPSTPARPSSPPARRTTTRPTTRRPRSRPSDRPKVMILGSGPNRIGQGIEFDYSCVHAVHGAARGRLRDRHGQLQPGDGLHRLRHRRPALLRAADLRGRAGGRATPRTRSGQAAGGPAWSA